MGIREHQYYAAISELVKPNNKFLWNETLEDLFQKSKEVLIQQSIDGIRTFDIARNTCIQTDWCKEGIGYLLLQQHCKCASGVLQRWVETRLRGISLHTGRGDTLFSNRR